MRKNRLRMLTLVVAALALFAILPLRATNEVINYEDIAKIKAEGLQHSQVMEIASWLSDVYAPRLMGSPMYTKAADWAIAKMKEWGLVNVKAEPWVNRNGFDRGWTNDKYYMAVVSPEPFPIPGTPTGWTPGTNGLVRGEAVLVTATTPEELAAYKGKLKGKWVLTQAVPEVPAYWTVLSKRYTLDELAAMELNPAPGLLEFGVTPPGQRAGAPVVTAPAAPAPQVKPAAAQAAAPAAAQQPAQKPQAQQPAAPAAGQRGGFGAMNARNEFFRAEGVLGLLSTAPRGHGIYVISGNRASDPATTLPAIVIPAEQYGRIGRILAKKIPVTIEADIKNTYYPNPQVFNVVGELPGSDKADELVMLGGHLDCWHAATGAADNGAGVTAMMEAMRILKATGVKLRRTVRIGLWGGEEQGLLGSREYVAAHFASRQALAAPAGTVPAAGAPPAAGVPPAAAGQRGGGFGGPQGPLEFKPEYNKLSAYYNIDNGTGAIRGIYLQGDDAAGPIFREWIEPLRSMGMTTVTIRNTGGTDHQSFDGVGLPGFQFIQDETEYNAIIHHTNLDTYERLQPNDMMKDATIAAVFVYLTANREEKIPRKPLATAGQRGR
ncbi:MAG: M20/M25/M40 family metallo-hydrolase [Candidatus Aminicenantales bacterium]